MSLPRARLYGLDGRLFMERLPVVGWQSTHSNDNAYTDSAASATAMATGYKTVIDSLGVNHRGDPLPTIAEKARDAGMRVGLITDSAIWDATPAAFAVHFKKRRELKEVARQMASSELHLLMGGEGAAADFGFWGRFRREKAVSDFEDQGYRVTRNWRDLLDSPAADGKLLALLPQGSIANPASKPDLTDLLRLAFERLSGPKGFFLLLETEEIDSASHAGDLKRVIDGMRALDDTVQQAVEFARRDEHTLVVVTSDHECGGLCLIWSPKGRPMQVNWGTSRHTGGPAPIFAFGPGAERFKGIRDNTDVAKSISDLLN